MNRREFLSASAAVVGSAAVSPGAAAAAAPRPHAAAELAAPPPGVDYFTEDRLKKAIDTSSRVDGVDFTTVCFTFNPWHPSPWMEARFGKGWTEWETMRMARQQFPGHYQPKRPLWGCFDDADPGWAAREVELAASSGIDVFMIDWYWHEGTLFYHEQLEQGLLKAPNKDKMKFAVMWANHDWTNLYPAPENGEEAIILPQNYSEADMDRLVGYLIDHYFLQSNYWKIDGKAVFGTYWTSHLIRFFGVDRLRKIFDRWQDRAIKAGLKGVYFQACSQFDGNTPLAQVGYSSSTEYHTSVGSPPGKQSSFAASAERAIQRWTWMAGQMKLPYFPQCPVGWDNSPRVGKNAHVVVNRTADQFERLLRAAKHFVVNRKIQPAYVYMGAWNEWTEDHYLLPDEVHGYQYLEAVKRQFG
jgi:hypothetical protein